MLARLARLAPAAAPLVFLPMALLVACGGSTTTPPDEGPATDTTDRDDRDGAPSSPASGGGPCRDGAEEPLTGATGGCYSATSHVCGDTFRPRKCVSGSFRCPSGTVPPSECWCYGMGRPSGVCSCSPTGWDCTDDDAGVTP